MNPTTHERVRARMRELRETAGYSQREVARRLGWSGETYRQKELGHLGLSGPDLARIAHLYDRRLRDAFPEYVPSEGERLLADHIGGNGCRSRATKAPT